MKKNRIATIILTMVIGITGLGLTSCAEPSPNDNYTGAAVVESHQTRNKGKCYIKIAFPDGEKSTRRVDGRRSACRTVKDGGKVTLEKGRVKDYEKK